MTRRSLSWCTRFALPLCAALAGLALPSCIDAYPTSTGEAVLPREVPDYFEPPEAPVDDATPVGLPAPRVVRPGSPEPASASGDVLDPGTPAEPEVFEDLLPWLVVGETSAWYELDAGSVELAWLDPAGVTRGQWSIPIAAGVATTVVTYDGGHASFTYDDPADLSDAWGVRQIAVDEGFTGAVRPAGRLVDALPGGSSIVVRALASPRRVHVDSGEHGAWDVAVDPSTVARGTALAAWVEDGALVTRPFAIQPARDRAWLRVVDPAGDRRWDVYLDCDPASERDADCERPWRSGESATGAFAELAPGFVTAHVVPSGTDPRGPGRPLQPGAGDHVQLTVTPGGGFASTDLSLPSGEGDVPVTLINATAHPWAVDLESLETPEPSKAPAVGARWQLFAGRSISLVALDATGELVGRTPALPQEVGAPYSWLILDGDGAFDARVIRDDVPAARADAGYLRLVHAAPDAPPLRPVIRGRIAPR